MVAVPSVEDYPSRRAASDCPAIFFGVSFGFLGSFEAKNFCLVLVEFLELQCPTIHLGDKKFGPPFLILVSPLQGSHPG